ncbi:MAG: KH domain-containing protein [Candidatus Aenigmarchaeota archaeon]|nr:KH domain-containing protein [Candidatus Aenigmarchaeota archaeon]
MSEAKLLKNEREFVIPGEEIVKSTDFLPGKNCFREGESIFAKKIGIVHLENRVISLIPLNSTYIPHAYDMVIGEVVDIQNNGWVVDIKAPDTAFLSLSGVREFVKNGEDLSKYYALGDVISAKIHSVNGSSTYLSMQDRVARKLKEGVILKVNPAKVPRIIGKQGSMINAIKDKTGTRISVGQNGFVWVQGENIDLVKKVIETIEKESFSEGLTEKIAEMLDKETKKTKVKEAPEKPKVKKNSSGDDKNDKRKEKK